MYMKAYVWITFCQMIYTVGPAVLTPIFMILLRNSHRQKSVFFLYLFTAAAMTSMSISLFLPLIMKYEIFFEGFQLGHNENYITAKLGIGMDRLLKSLVVLVTVVIALLIYALGFCQTYKELHEGSGSMSRSASLESKSLLLKSASEVDDEVTDTWCAIERWTLPSVAAYYIAGMVAHSLFEGLLMGAAFSTDVNAGISQVIVLLSLQLSLFLGFVAVAVDMRLEACYALILSLTSRIPGAVLSYIISVIPEFEMASPWSLAVVVGLYLFIALGLLVPRSQDIVKQSHASFAVYVFLGCAGCLVGGAFPILLSYMFTHIG